MRHGVIVLNAPNGLSKAINKMYFQLFPEELRPRTLLSHNRDEIKAFVKDQGKQAVLKPLQGSGGAGVLLVKPADASNLNQMIESLTRDGYVIAHEYLTAAQDGDTRHSGVCVPEMTCAATFTPGLQGPAEIGDTALKLEHCNKRRLRKSPAHSVPSR